MQEKITQEQIKIWRKRWAGKEDVVDDLIDILKGCPANRTCSIDDLLERLKMACNFLKENNIDIDDENDVQYPNTFYSLDLRGIDLSNRNIIGIDFKSARLQASTFKNSFLQDIKFYFADIREAKFEETTLINISFIKTYLQGAFFWIPERVHSVSFEESFLQGTSFIDMDLTSCIFQDAEFGEEIVNIEYGPNKQSTYFKNCKFLPRWRDHFTGKREIWEFVKVVFNRIPEDKKEKWSFEKNIVKNFKNNPLFKHLFEPWFYTNFEGVNIDAADTVIAPDLYRYVKDQQYLYRFKQKHKILYQLWRWTCGCGNSILFWGLWCFVFILLFGFASADYTLPNYIPDFIAVPIDIINPVFENVDGEPMRGWFFDSFIDFFTLSYGNAKPLNFMGKFWIFAEVLINYLMLGGLISIFTNKLARRSG